VIDLIGGRCRTRTVEDAVNAQVARRDLAIAWNLFFAKYDLLLSPVVAVAPFETGKNAPRGEEGKPNMMWLPYTPQFNLSRPPVDDRAMHRRFRACKQVLVDKC
jgi:aspartyl-tRNA(Asn)/glutamyl-tRNA(Gln) amidotransferase subunit A